MTDSDLLLPMLAHLQHKDHHHDDDEDDDHHHHKEEKKDDKKKWKVSSGWRWLQSCAGA